MWIAKDATIILDLDDIIEPYHISCETEGFSIVQFKTFEPVVLHKYGLLNLIRQQGFFLVSVFDKLPSNMTSASKAEEEIHKHDGR